MANASFDVDADKQRTTGKIGPGVVVLIVGPSGAGKDALLKGAADHLSENSRFHFAKRNINRPSHEAEDNRVLAVDDPTTVAKSDAYALHWQAHGLVYAISADIDGHLRAGRCVIFNASRTIIAAARRRYEMVRIIYVTASRRIRAQRLVFRGRETREAIESRLAREVSSFPPSAADHQINNEHTLETGVQELVALLSDLESSA